MMNGRRSRVPVKKDVILFVDAATLRLDALIVVRISVIGR